MGIIFTSIQESDISSFVAECLSLKYTREICQSNDFAGSPDYALSFSRILIYFCPNNRVEE